MSCFLNFSCRLVCFQQMQFLIVSCLLTWLGMNHFQLMVNYNYIPFCAFHNYIKWWNVDICWSFMNLFCYMVCYWCGWIMRNFINKWKLEEQDSLDYHPWKFSKLHTNIKLKAIFKINIVNFLIIHVVVDFNGNHLKFSRWILKR